MFISARGPRSQDLLAQEVKGLNIIMPSPAAMKPWRLIAQGHRQIDSLGNAKKILNGTFNLLHEEVQTTFPPQWNSKGKKDPALWHFHLHYHEWVWSLVEDGRLLEVSYVLADWIDKNKLGAPGYQNGPWSPYTISIRLEHWMALFALLHSSGIDEHLSLIANSIKAQVLFLSKNLEWQHGANHLLENLLTLEMASHFLQGQWINENRVKWRKLLLHELERQFPTDGFHYENSPAYHNQLMRRCLVVYTLDPHFKEAGKLLELGLRSSQLLTTPKGKPLAFGDGNDESLSYATLQKFASHLAYPLPSKEEKTATNIANHVVYTNKRSENFLVFDIANLGPDNNGAHQHSDLLGLEFWHRGKAIIRDGGAGRYIHGKERDQLRAAREHFALTIDDHGPCDPWKSFRMGHRGHVTYRRIDLRQDGFESDAEQDGFMPVGVLHRRRVRFSEELRQLVIIDRLTRKNADLAKVNLYIPLAPNMTIRRINDLDFLLIPKGEDSFVRLEMRCNHHCTARIESGKLWRGFNRHSRRRILVYTAELSSLSLSFRSKLSWD